MDKLTATTVSGLCWRQKGRRFSWLGEVSAVGVGVMSWWGWARESVGRGKGIEGAGRGKGTGREGTAGRGSVGGGRLVSGLCAERQTEWYWSLGG